MQTCVLAFIELDPPHSEHVIADAIYEFVTEWKIENKVISITLDNASNNDGAVNGLKAKFAVRRGMGFEAQYFHARCCACIINLVVQDGTTVMAPFLESLKRDCQTRLATICQTRWRPTYKMISTVDPYRQALASYAASNANYQWESAKKEWDMFELIGPLLESLSLVTTTF